MARTNRCDRAFIQLMRQPLLPATNSSFALAAFPPSTTNMAEMRAASNERDERADEEVNIVPDWEGPSEQRNRVEVDCSRDGRGRMPDENGEDDTGMLSQVGKYHDSSTLFIHFSIVTKY